MYKDIVYFHGQKKGVPLKEPSLTYPLYITPDFDLAQDYNPVDNPEIHVLTVKHEAKVFSFCGGADIPKLGGGRSIYSDTTLDLMAKLYRRDSPKFTFWASTHRRDFFEAVKMLRAGISKETGLEDLYVSFLANDINHNKIEYAEIIGRPEKETARKMVSALDEAGFGSIGDFVESGRFLENVREDGEFKRLTLLRKFQVHVVADMLDAISDERYPFDFLSYRRPLYKSILEMGYSIVQDNETDGSGVLEYAVLDGKALDKILNVPIAQDELGFTFPVMTELGNSLRGESFLPIESFERMLKKAKERPANV